MRPIDADALPTKAIEGRRFVFAYKDLLNDELVVRTVYKDLAEFISAAPTLALDDLRPQGQWVSNGIPDSMLSKCTACGFSCGAYSFRYCPNCGADMRGGGEDG